MPTETTTAVRRVAFDRFDTFPKLFATYCTNYDALADYYAGDFRDPAAREAAARRAAEHPRDREQLVDVLREQNEAWDAGPATLANLEKLRDPEAVAVVTGQQVGLLSGPLYTVYKTLSALRLARQMAEETGRPVVPVFWVEGEDHDFDEVAGIGLLRRNEAVAVRYYRPGEEDGQPAGRHVLTPEIEEVLDKIDETLPGSDFKPQVMQHVRGAYRPGRLFEDAFVHFMQSLFPETGLVYINPDDRRLKAQTAPLFERELRDYTTVARRLEAVSERLEEEYHAQVWAQSPNLFLLEEGGRFPVDAREEGGFELRRAEPTYTQDELLALLESEPERFSPNVVLRPLMQDMLLPTAAYVAGPGEVSYFAQYKKVYEWAGVPMPIIYPRASVTLVESKVQKVLDRFELDVPAFGEDLDRLFQRVVMEDMEEDVDEMFGEATRRMHQALNDLKPSVEAVDATLNGSVEAARAALAKEMEQLKGRVVKAEKRSQDEVRAQLAKAHANLYPEGKLQERSLNVLYFINKYSTGVIDELAEALSLDTTAHQVVNL